MITDGISDFLTIIRNAHKAEIESVKAPASKIKAGICKVLKDEGFIKSFKIIAKSTSDISLKVVLKPNAIIGLKRVSKPGLRVYKPCDELPTVLSGLGICIVSTSSGLMSSRKAKKLGLGGEIICKVW